MAQKKKSSSSTASEASNVVLTPSLEREARALDPKSISQVRLPLDIVRHNALVGATAVLGQREVIATLLKKPNFAEVERMVSLVDLTIRAAQNAATTEATGTTYEADIKALYPLRKMLLSAANSLVDAGFLPAKDVAAIHAGKGRLDAADDAIALAALFTKNKKKVAGKTPITDEHIAEAEAVGLRLKAVIKPTKARSKREKDEAQADAAGLRDRLYTMVLNAHEVTWKLGAMVWGKDVDKHVPPLGSRIGK